MEVKIKLLDNGKMPYQKHSTDACWDLFAASKKSISYNLIEYGLGFCLEIPEGYRMDIVPRSSIKNTGLSLTNSPGTVDADYRGEVKAVFRIEDSLMEEYEVGDRIAQMRLEKVLPIEFKLVSELSDTDRGNGGYGSTGTN